MESGGKAVTKRYRKKITVVLSIPKRMRKKLNSFLTMKKSWKHARLCRTKGGLVKP